MNWLSSNWIWILLFAFVAFHLFGHRYHRHGYAPSAHRHDGHDGEGAPAQNGEPRQASNGQNSAHTTDSMTPQPATSEPRQPSTPNPDEQPHRHRGHGC